MTAHELQAQLRSSHPPKLLHVLPPEIHAATHIPGSGNACVYETTFLDQAKTLIPDPSTPLIVYGAGEGSLDATTAAEKLRASGFSQVHPFEGGLAEWQSAGLPLEGTGQLPQPPVPDGVYQLDAAQSVIRWTGRNLFNHHSGTVKLASGEIHLRQGELVSATFTIDMTSIACEDLADPAYNAMLLAHLRTADFFDVDQHPPRNSSPPPATSLAPAIAPPRNLIPAPKARPTISCAAPSPSGASPSRWSSPSSSPRRKTPSASPARASSNSTAPPTAATTAPANSSASLENTSSTTSSICMSRSTPIEKVERHQCRFDARACRDS